MTPIGVMFCGICGICGISPEALMREKKVSWGKLSFPGVEEPKQTPQTPQTPQLAFRISGDFSWVGSAQS